MKIATEMRSCKHVVSGDENGRYIKLSSTGILMPLIYTGRNQESLAPPTKEPGFEWFTRAHT
jgi:hypothetical protein